MAIYGECVGSGTRAQVQISDLAGTGCDLAARIGEAMPDGEFALWIGAMGPFAATATRTDAEHLSAKFREPLDPRIIEHFGHG